MNIVVLRLRLPYTKCGLTKIRNTLKAERGWLNWQLVGRSIFALQDGSDSMMK
jgi:hypothetical protein